MSTIGDPLSDLGTALAYWVDAKDSDELQQVRWSPSNYPGSLTRAQLVERYAQATGRDVSSMAFYLAFCQIQSGRHPAANLLSLSPGTDTGSALRFVAAQR